MRRALVALVLGLMIGISVPVMADHINEPTAPITGIRLRLYRYPDGTVQSVRNDSGTVTNVAGCDGSVVVDFNNLRIETSVQALTAVNGNPSEHYTERIELAVVSNFGKTNEATRYEWNADWNHSNIPPHAKPGANSDRGWESSQNNQNLTAYAPGSILRVIHRLIGMESGVLLIEACTFTVG